jgi:hypothetical protein
MPQAHSESGPSDFDKESFFVFDVAACTSIDGSEKPFEFVWKNIMLCHHKLFGINVN